MLSTLINNIAFLVALVSAGQLVISHEYKSSTNRGIVLGVLFGGVAILGMVNPFVLMPGVIFDGRTIVLAVAGVVGGGLAAAIAAAMAAIYRFEIGGPGVIVGMSVVILSATLGVLARAWWQRRPQPPKWFDYVALGVAVQLMQITAFTQIPNRAGYAFIEQAWWILLVPYPLATMLLCLMFRNFEQQLLDKAALRVANEARAAEEKASLQRFHAYFDQSNVGLAITSPEKGWIEVNNGLCVTLGYSKNELMRMTWAQITHPDDLSADLTNFNQMLAGEINHYSMDKRFIHKDGHEVYVRLSVSSVRKNDGSIDYILALIEDISERHHALNALKVERAHLRTLVSAIPDLIWLKDADGRYISCNREFERFFGAEEKDIIGKTDYDFVNADLAEQFRQNDRAAMAAGGPTRNEEWITYASDGRRLLLETTKVPIRTTDDRLIGVLGVGHDITERHQHQLQLEHMAHFDTLTGLPNRLLLGDRLRQALVHSQRRETVLVVAYLDLDGFKGINDRYGHDTGDQLLKALAGNMARALREVDTLARLGGDEFVAIFADLPTVESAQPLLTRLLDVVSDVVQIENVSLKITASLGVTFYPQDDVTDADQLIRQADQAMYQAKQMGKNQFHFFDPVHDRSVRGHHEELQRLKRALHEREFVLFYQPKVNMRTGEVIGLEALIRWQHPERGLVPPSEFLPLITDQPLVVELGYWVIDTVMSQIEAWKAEGLQLQVSINVDAIHLEQSDFVERLRALKAVHPKISDDDVELEVLETNALDDTVRVSQVIRACREMGIGFALDDFGTGYSSLTYLKQLPAELLKIDQSFVRGLLNQPDDLSILDGILSLARAFRRRVIAEGVETFAHCEMLLRLGCDLAQGYAIARPMPVDRVAAWVATWRPEDSWRTLQPIEREDLPVLIASVECRAWVKQIEDFLTTDKTHSPDLNREWYRFGERLRTYISTLPNGNNLSQELNRCLDEIFSLVDKLMGLKHQGQTDLAVAQMPDLYDLQDRFLTQLTELLP
ncbi:MAG: EAL domain-containing protein [Burkholderiaceae bacterium]|nr:EAL domain-containing protein [Burkholderiaceae bacterium]